MILCRKCGAEGTHHCSMPGCPLPPMKDTESQSQTTMLAEARALFEAAKRANDRESADRLSRQALALAIEVGETECPNLRRPNFRP